MQDLRCVVGWHDFVEAHPNETVLPRVEGKLPVACTRCHRAKNIPMPVKAPSGPRFHEGSPSGGSF